MLHHVHEAKLNVFPLSPTLTCFPFSSIKFLHKLNVSFPLQSGSHTNQITSTLQSISRRDFTSTTFVPFICRILNYIRIKYFLFIYIFT